LIAGWAIRDAAMKESKTVREAVTGAARMSAEGKRQLPCAKAFALKKRHGIALRRIGEICEQEDIRIVKCQLGCFR